MKLYKKKCSKCKKTKSINQFNKRKTSKDGYRSQCRQCEKQYRLNNLAKFREYAKKYYNNNKDKVKEYREKNKKYRLAWIKNWRKKHPEIKRNWQKRHPWYGSYRSAVDRCRNSNHIYYKYYGGRGIKLLMNPNDFKFLWFRDKAYLLKRPSIDRKNNNGNYTLKNCRFIEMTENLSRRKNLKGKKLPYERI